MHAAIASLYVSAGDPNSEPHTCRASSLSTEPSPSFFLVLSNLTESSCCLSLYYFTHFVICFTREMCCRNTSPQPQQPRVAKGHFQSHSFLVFPSLSSPHLCGVQGQLSQLASSVLVTLHFPPGLSEVGDNNSICLMGC